MINLLFFEILLYVRGLRTKATVIDLFYAEIGNSPISISPRQLRCIPNEKAIYIPDLIKRIITEKSREIQLAEQYQFDVKLSRNPKVFHDPYPGV